MSLLSPVAVAAGFPFGGYNIYEPSVYHVGTTSAMFGWYSGSVRADHFHLGLDFPAVTGTPIVASEAGVVTFAGWAPNPGPDAGGGLVIEVRIAGGVTYLSAHCSSLKVGLGAHVTRGQQIASVGATGTATGPHDHFSCFTIDGYGARTFWNPALFLPGGSWQNDPRIQPQHYTLSHANYPAARKASIAKGKTIHAYEPNHPGAVYKTYTAPATRGSSFWVVGKTTVSWSPSPGPIPRGTFLQAATPTGGGGILANLLILMGEVTAADGKPW